MTPKGGGARRDRVVMMTSSLQRHGVIGVAGFIFGRHPDGPFAPDGALVFADAAADAVFRPHVGLLEPDQDVGPRARHRR